MSALTSLLRGNDSDQREDPGWLFGYLCGFYIPSNLKAFKSPVESILEHSGEEASSPDPLLLLPTNINHGLCQALINGKLHLTTLAIVPLKTIE